MSTRRWISLIVALLLGTYKMTGLAVVQPDEVAVVRRLGVLLSEPWEPGLHWDLPWGFDRLDRLKTNQTRTIIVGSLRYSSRIAVISVARSDIR